MCAGESSLLHYRKQTPSISSWEITAGGRFMKPTKGKLSFIICGPTMILFMATLIGCGEDPGLYQQEELVFDSGSYQNSKEEEIDLGSDESKEFGFWPPALLPAPPFIAPPIFPYYREPVPVAVPISPYQAITEWVHPMYAVGMFQPFWPNLFGP